MKKILLLFLFLGTAITIDAQTMVGDLYYYLDNKTAVVAKPTSGTYTGTSYTIPATVYTGGKTYNVTGIDKQAFKNCSNLTTINMSSASNLSSIGTEAFYRCTKLTSISIPNNVTSIGNNAFQYCGAMTSLTIGTSVRTIGEYAFSNCRKVTSVEIPNSVTSIGQYAFEYCSAMTSLTLSSNITTIPQYAFNGCSKLTSVIIPDNVTTIGTSAFDGCNYLASLTLGSGLTSIGSRAFSNNRLSSLAIPASVTTIGEQAFVGSDRLTSIVVDTENEAFDSRDNCNAIIEKATNTLVFGSTKTVIPNTVTSIGPYAFVGLSITTITIPSSVTTIGKGAFGGCRFTSLTIPSTVTSINSNAFETCPYLTNVTFLGATNIGVCAFWKCSKLTSVNLGSQVTSIGDQAFSECKKLTSISIPSTVHTIGQMAFDGCSELTSVTLNEGIEEIQLYAFAYTDINSIRIPASVSQIGAGIFTCCNSLTSIVVDEDNEVYDSRGNCNAIIKKANRELIAGCNTTEIPCGVEIISNYSFIAMINRTSITIPASVTSIGDAAFQYCTGLTDIYCAAREVPATGYSVFEEVPNANVTLHVPASSIAAYSAVSPWRDFGTIEEFKQSVTIGSAGVATYCSIYDLDFSEVEGLKAFIVSAYRPSTAEVTMSRIKDVPAETGLVLMGEAGSYEVPLGTGETVVANMLVGTTAPTVLAKEDGEYVNYIFAKKGGVLGFYPVVDGSTLGANKAYLPLLAWKLPEEAQSRVGVFFEDENDSPGTTGVKDLNMQRANDSQVFDLQGRPVKTPRKGLYVKGNKIVKF